MIAHGLLATPEAADRFLDASVAAGYPDIVALALQHSRAVGG
jgi:hypothetical protein